MLNLKGFAVRKVIFITLLIILGISPDVKTQTPNVFEGDRYSSEDIFAGWLKY